MTDEQFPVFFADAPAGLDQAEVVIVPVPYDGTSTWGKGADRGPAAQMRSGATTRRSRRPLIMTSLMTPEPMNPILSISSGLWGVSSCAISISLCSWELLRNSLGRVDDPEDLIQCGSLRRGES